MRRDIQQQNNNDGEEGEEEKNALQRILIDNIDLTRIFFLSSPHRQIGWNEKKKIKKKKQSSNANNNERRTDEQVLSQAMAIHHNKNSSMRTKSFKYYMTVLFVNLYYFYSLLLLFVLLFYYYYFEARMEYNTVWFHLVRYRCHTCGWLMGIYTHKTTAYPHSRPLTCARKKIYTQIYIHIKLCKKHRPVRPGTNDIDICQAGEQIHTS